MGGSFAHSTVNGAKFRIEPESYGGASNRASRALATCHQPLIETKTNYCTRKYWDGGEREGDGAFEDKSIKDTIL